MNGSFALISSEPGLGKTKEIKMQLRILPWFTDDSVIFLNNLFKWYPKVLNEQMTVLEFGGGNSTLYFLQKGCKIVTVESDEMYINDLLELANNINATSTVVDSFKVFQENSAKYDLIIFKANDYDSIKRLITNNLWSIIINDGILRATILNDIYNHIDSSIIILDNIEFAANWGKLARSSGKANQSVLYREILRSKDWCKYLFEQKEGREGYSSGDFTGWECPNRLITGILWKESHILSKFMITNQGLPLVNIDGIDNKDLLDLEERCPYDFKKGEWRVEEYPKSLDLKLLRSYR